MSRRSYTTQEATAASPCVWLTSKHSMRCTVSGRPRPSPRAALLGIVREEAAIAQMPPAAHHDKIHTRQAVPGSKPDHIGVLARARVRILPLRHLGKRLYLVPVDRRLLEAQAVRRRLHARSQAP